MTTWYYGVKDKVAKAEEFSKIYHGNQTRKYTDELYYIHPAAVAKIIRTVEHTDEMIAAAYLHDLVEDTIATHGLILQEFGSIIFSYVYFLTDVSRSGKTGDGNRDKRKIMDRAHNVDGPPESQTIKVADMIDNSISIILHDEHFATVFMREMEVTVNSLYRADPILIAQAQGIISDYKKGKE